MICHCGQKLTKKRSAKGRKNLYYCKTCDCTYCFVLVRMSVECSRKLYKDRAITLKEVRQKKRGRKKK